MNKIQPDETILKASWGSNDGIPEASETTRRIYELTTSYLAELGSDASGWETLYFDTSDRRFWERTYPYGATHGGGPPELRCVSKNEAQKKYGSSIINKSLAL